MLQISRLSGTNGIRSEVKSELLAQKYTWVKNPVWEKENKNYSTTLKLPYVFTHVHYF